MKITILTLFPEMFAGPFEQSIVKRAQEKNIVEIAYVNIRDFGIGTHKMVDDTPYGGGVGMVLKIDVLHKAIEHAKSHSGEDGGLLQNPDSGQARMTKHNQRVILMSASGKTY